MATLTQELAEMLDRDKIRDCLARLARGEDRRDAELIAECYWPDVIVDLGIFTGGLAEYLAWVVPGSVDIPVTQHILGQSHINLCSNAAMVETHVLAYHRVFAGEGEYRDSVIGGRYLDRLERVNGTWRISQRAMIYDWVQDAGPSVDWSRGLMGMPLAIDRYTGCAARDFSERFFADCRMANDGDAVE